MFVNDEFIKYVNVFFNDIVLYKGIGIIWRYVYYGCYIL